MTTLENVTYQKLFLNVRLSAFREFISHAKTKRALIILKRSFKIWCEYIFWIINLLISFCCFISAADGVTGNQGMCRFYFMQYYGWLRCWGSLVSSCCVKLYAIGVILVFRSTADIFMTFCQNLWFSWIFGTNNCWVHSRKLKKNQRPSPDIPKAFLRIWQN